MKIVDLTGMRFAKLVVLKKSQEKGARNQIKWDCICDCGKPRTMDGGTLKDYKSLRCCPTMIAEKPIAIRHGMSKSRLYRIYRHMINRCKNSKVESYYLYGGRGISVCDEWQKFEPFRDWALSNGYKENLSIDRIDNELGYFPGNCKWSTNFEQAQNKRNTVLNFDTVRKIRELRASGVKNKVLAEMFGVTRTTISDVFYNKVWVEGDLKRFSGDMTVYFTHEGETKCATEWAKDPRIKPSYGTLIRRKRAGMSDFDALFSKRKTHNSGD